MWWFLLLFCAGAFEEALRSGLLSLNNNQLSAAQSQLEEASRLEPDDARVWLALAQTYWKLHKPQEADQAAKHSSQLTTNPALLRALAIYYAGTGNRDKTVEIVQLASKQVSLQEAEYFALADICLKLQNFTTALEVLAIAHKIFSQSTQLELATGVAYYGLRRFPEAIDAFLRTAELDPKLEQPYVFLGRILEQAEGNLPKIQQSFAALVKSEPDNYLSCYLYGKSLVLTDPVGAETFLRKSIALNNGFADSHFELANFLEQQQKWESAVAELRQSIQLNPQDPVPHYHLARDYDRLGQPEKARFERELHAKLSAPATVVK